MRALHRAEHIRSWLVGGPVFIRFVLNPGLVAAAAPAPVNPTIQNNAIPGVGPGKGSDAVLSNSRAEPEKGTVKVEMARWRRGKASS